MSRPRQAHLDGVLLKPMAQVSQTILKAANMHRQGYPVRMLCPTIKPTDCVATHMALNGFLCYLSNSATPLQVFAVSRLHDPVL